MRFQLLFIVLSLFASCAYANDEPPSLKSSFLKKLADYRTQPSSAPLTAQVQLKTRLEDGKSKHHKLRTGEILLNVKDDADGLAVSFSAELMQLLNQERDRALQAPDEKGPTLIAFNEISSSVLRDMSDAAATLQRQIDNAEFLAEERIECEQSNCWRLRYRFGDERLSSASKRFVKEFDGRLDITVDANARPLRAKLTQRAKGRAFVFLSFRSDVDEVWDFAEAGQRLVAVRHTRRSESAGGGERGLRWLDYRMQVEGLDAKPWMLCERADGLQNDKHDPKHSPTHTDTISPAC